MEYLLDILIIFLAYMLGFGRGYNHREQVAVKKIHSALDDVVAKVEANTIRITVEKVHTMFYAYDADKKTFLGQGNSKKDLFNTLRLSYPSNNFAIDPENFKELGWSNE
jgi:hypothetical protein